MKYFLLILMLTYTSMNAFSLEEIVLAEHKIDRLQTVVGDYHQTIDKSRISHALDILEHYPNAHSYVVQKWFDIVLQDEIKIPHKVFVAKTQRRIRFYLEQMLFDPQKPMTLQDYQSVKQKLAVLIVNDFAQKATGEGIRYRVMEHLNLRNLPIVSPFTRSVVIPKNTLLKSCYTLVYRSSGGRTSRWGYVTTPSNQKGWINLRYVNTVDGGTK